MDDQDVIREFVIESNENLARLDQEMVELEKSPQDPQLLAGIFRTIHTIKGTCGFLGFASLEGVTHLAENLLSQLRDGKRELSPDLVTLILEAVDVVKTVLLSIEATGGEGTETYDELRKRLQIACALTPSGTPCAASFQAAPGAETAAAAKGPSISDSSIRVDVGLLDKLMNLVGELVLARNQILQFNAQQEDATLNATSQRLNLITTELQEGVMKTRMQPIGVVWNKLPRLVRDLAAALRQADPAGDGWRRHRAGQDHHRSHQGSADPHRAQLLRPRHRNAGSARPRMASRRKARLTLRAFHEGGQVNIEIADDGAGIDVRESKTRPSRKA